SFHRKQYRDQAGILENESLANSLRVCADRDRIVTAAESNRIVLYEVAARALASHQVPGARHNRALTCSVSFFGKESALAHVLRDAAHRHAVRFVLLEPFSDRGVLAEVRPGLHRVWHNL